MIKPTEKPGRIVPAKDDGHFTQLSGNIMAMFAEKSAELKWHEMATRSL